MKKILLCLSALFTACTIFANAEFTKPTIVQNYPVDHILPLNNTQISYKAISRLIKSAKKKIDIEIFYIDNKNTETPILKKYILDPIIKKASEGVKIRILVDSLMAKNDTDTLKKLNSIPNISIRKTSAFKGVMHAKLIVVDDSTFYLGSHNFDWITYYLNHELGVILKNRKLAGFIDYVFNYDWQNYNTNNFKPTKITTAESGNYKISITPDSSNMSSGEKEFLNLLDHAKKSISMQAMQVTGTERSYITHKDETWKKFGEAILHAANNRNVKIKIMMSNWAFTKSYIKESNEFLQMLLKNNTKGNIEIRYSSFPQHKPCIPYSEVDHSKYMIVDDNIAWISTANITHSYFTDCRNYSLTVRNNSKLASQLQNIFNTMWNSKYIHKYSKEVTQVVDNTCSQTKCDN